MNFTTNKINFEKITCWESFGDNKSGRNAAQNALLGILVVLALCNIVSSVWCVIATMSAVKLRKPLWIFKASMAIKDVIFSITMTTYAIWNIFINTLLNETPSISSETKSLFNPGEFICNVIFLMCISSSFVHILLITFDRHQVIARPFRYHTGELFPSTLAYVLAGSGWTFSFVIALTVTTQSLETAEREMNLIYVGVLFPIYRTAIVQKWLLGAGMCLVYAVTLGLFAEAFSTEWNRAKRRKARIVCGVGELEPVRSRNNSVCQSSRKRKNNAGVDEPGTNSETDANEFLLTGGFGQDLSKKDECNEEAFIFTPVNYRPSLRRRIRDSWSLYSALICFIAFTILVAIPFIVIVLAVEPEAIPISGNKLAKPYSYCVGVSVTECMLVIQGFVYITVYVIIDDVFRPYFLRPFQTVQRKRKKQQTQARIQHDASEDSKSTRNRNA